MTILKKRKPLNNADPTVQRYEIKELKTHAKELFGVRAEVLAGAMYGTAGERFTIEEVKEQVEKFLKAKVN